MSSFLAAGWSFDPFVSALLGATALLYLGSVRRYAVRYPRRSFSAWRAACFLLGLALVVVALESQIDTYGDVLFSVHMVQHIVWMMFAAPLLVLGEPLTLLLATAPEPIARRAAAVLRSVPVRILEHPAFAWCAFAVVLWGTHYSPLYELALQNERVHQAEHALFLFSALLFWYCALASNATSWTSRPLSYPLRLVYVLSFMPQSAFLGLSFCVSARVFYPHYARVAGASTASALTDQQLGGTVMWLVDGVVMLAAILVIMALWAREDMARAERADARFYAAGGR